MILTNNNLIQIHSLFRKLKVADYLDYQFKLNIINVLNI